mgnify:FL=1
MKNLTLSSLIIFIILALSLVPSVNAIGIMGSTLTYEDAYVEPISFDYAFRASTTPTASVNVNGNLAPYVTLSEKIFTSTSDSFTAEIDLGENPEAGTYNGQICVSEVPVESDGSFSVSTASCAHIRVYVLYDNSYSIIHQLNSWSGDIAKSVVTITNYGKQDTSELDLEVTLISPEEETITSSTQSTETIVSRAAQELIFEFDTTDFEAGVYTMLVETTENGEKLSSEKTVRIGKSQLILTETSFAIDNIGIQKITIPLESQWFESVQAYVELEIENIISTSSVITINEWGTASADIFLDTASLPLGKYSALTTGYLNGERTFVEEVTITISEPEIIKEVSKTQGRNLGLKSIAIISILVVILLAVAAVYNQKNKKTSKNYEDNEDF